MRVLILLSAAVLAAVAAPTPKTRYDGYQVFRINPQTQGALDSLAQLHKADVQGLDFWKTPNSIGGDIDINASPEAKEGLLNYLAEAGIAYSTMIDNLQTLLDDEERQQRMVRNTPGTYDFNSYKTYEQLMDWLDTIAAGCSHCSTQVIGRSYNGNDLKYIKIGYSGSNKPAIWIDCGIHAREWISPAAGMYIATQLASSNVDSETQQLLQTFDFYILPSANPDGYIYSHTNDRLWRKTRSRNSGSSCIGTDPNRNWGFHWGETGASTNPCSDIYMGSSEFSEPETRAISDFILSQKGTFKAYITVHSYGQYWLTPWGWTSDLPDTYNDLKAKGDIAANAIRAVHNKRFSVGSSTNLLYAAAGGSDDWAYALGGCDYAYTPELRDTGRYGFVLPTSQIQDAGEETWAGVKAFASAIVNRYR